MIDVRLDTIDGETKWRAVRDLEHATLCRAFGLDQASFWFDLPSSVRGVGSNMVGAGGNRNGRIIDGYVMRGRTTEPFGKITINAGPVKVRDVDPTDRRELYRLGGQRL